LTENPKYIDSTVQKLVVATGNPGKLEEMQEYLTDLPWELILKPAEIDVDETGTTFIVSKLQR
jgi:XTP/dITP diphosphohydrolase